MKVKHYDYKYTGLYNTFDYVEDTYEEDADSCYVFSFDVNNIVRLRRHLLSEGGKCQGGTGESRRILRLSLGESCTFLRLPPWGKAWRRKGAKKRREPKLSSLFALGLDYLVITLKTIVVATPLASVLAPK